MFISFAKEIYILQPYEYYSQHELIEYMRININGTCEFKSM